MILYKGITKHCAKNDICIMSQVESYPDKVIVALGFLIACLVLLHTISSNFKHCPFGWNILIQPVMLA